MRAPGKAPDRGSDPSARRGAVEPREQRGARYAVVVQADELLALSSVLVSPTSVSAPPCSFRPTIQIDGARTRVLVEQTTAVSSDRLGPSAVSVSRRAWGGAASPPTSHHRQEGLDAGGPSGIRTS